MKEGNGKMKQLKREKRKRRRAGRGALKDNETRKGKEENKEEVRK